MRNFYWMAAALAAVSCGGNSTDLSHDEAQSVASEISGALQERAAGGSNEVSFGGDSSTTYSCAGGGTVAVSGSLSINCPRGIFSCTTSGTLTVAANQCTTTTGAIVNGSLSATVTGTGI